MFAPFFAAIGTITQLDRNGRDLVIALLSKELFRTEPSKFANDRDLLALVKFFERFGCYLEGSIFQSITDNPDLKHNSPN